LSAVDLAFFPSPLWISIALVQDSCGMATHTNFLYYFSHLCLLMKWLLGTFVLGTGFTGTSVYKNLDADSWA